jgi:hypothetical protein
LSCTDQNQLLSESALPPYEDYLASARLALQAA